MAQWLVRRRRWAAAAGAAVLVAGLAATAPLFGSEQGAGAAPKPTPSASPSASASPSPSPSAVPWGSATAAPAGEPTVVPAASATPVAKPAESVQRPGPTPGAFAAEPARARTGDGDCLNVRIVPGKAIDASGPRDCVAEGTLLWLYGSPVEADGETWRHALGQGWVAARYLQPTPGASRTWPAGYGGVIVEARDGGLRVVRVNADGAATELASVNNVSGGLGEQPPSMAPDGRWLAARIMEPDSKWPDLRVYALGGQGGPGEPMQFADTANIAWSSNGLLLVATATPAGCLPSCTWKGGYLDPATGSLRMFEGIEADWWSAQWGPDGKWFVVKATGGLLKVALDGTKQAIPLALPADTYIGRLAVSPDGRRVLAESGFGPLRVIALEAGAITEVQRAVQVATKGGCGGATGRQAAWVDGDTIAWHEAFAAKGANGITIANLRTGARRLYPFTNVEDLRAMGPGLLTVATYEYTGSGGSFPLTWVLDTATGEARPVTPGSAPVWLK